HTGSLAPAGRIRVPRASAPEDTLHCPFPKAANCPPGRVPLLIVYIFLDTLEPPAHNPVGFTGRLLFAGSLAARRLFLSPPAHPQFCEANRMQYLPGWTVQCLNQECPARGHWLRVEAAPQDLCSNCGAPLHRVPPPLGP